MDRAAFMSYYSESFGFELQDYCETVVEYKDNRKRINKNHERRIR